MTQNPAVHSEGHVRGFPSGYTRKAQPSDSLFEGLAEEESPVHPLRCVDDVYRLETRANIKGCQKFETLNEPTNVSMCCRINEWVLYNSLSVICIIKSFFDRAIY